MSSTVAGKINVGGRSCLRRGKCGCSSILAEASQARYAGLSRHEFNAIFHSRSQAWTGADDLKRINILNDDITDQSGVFLHTVDSEAMALKFTHPSS